MLRDILGAGSQKDADWKGSGFLLIFQDSPSWDSEFNLASFDGNIGVALDSFARHVGRKENCSRRVNDS
jgi:hypothetical protein